MRVSNDGGIGIQYTDRQTLVTFNFPPTVLALEVWFTVNRFANRRPSESILVTKAPLTCSMPLLVKFSAKCCVKWLSPRLSKGTWLEIKRYHFPHECPHRQAFVIHCRHDAVRIYYAELPNVYLRRIFKYGAEQWKHLDEYLGYKRADRVKLRRTRVYHFRSPKELGLLFQEVAYLILYLRSGQARTGYLFNYPENPLHKLVKNPLIDLANGRVKLRSKLRSMMRSKMTIKMRMYQLRGMNPIAMHQHCQPSKKKMRKLRERRMRNQWRMKGGFDDLSIFNYKCILIPKYHMKRFERRGAQSFGRTKRRPQGTSLHPSLVDPYAVSNGPLVI